MSANSSYLSSPRYGYDFVVATTQNSINATMKRYLDTLDQSDTYIIFKEVGGDDDTDPQTVQVSFDQIKADAKGTDPFSIEADAKSTDSRIQNLVDSGFVAGIKVTLGLPQNFEDPTKLPDIVNLRDGASSVIYNMLCADIKICEITFDRRGKPRWKAISQNDTPDQAWIFESKVDLRLDTAEFSKLPQDVREGIKNLDGEMFGVQQLLFDLNNAGLQTVPSINGLDSTSNTNVLLTKYFVNTYFKHMHDQGQPVLNYVVVHKPQDATLKPTDLNFHVSPNGSLDPGLKTLDYLCATGNKRLPPAVDFTWSWMNGFDASQAHGVICINRDTFAKYLMEQIFPDAREDCFIPYANVTADMWGTTTFWAKPNGTPDDSQITHEVLPSGNRIINISWSKEDRDYAGLDGALGHVILRNDYTKTVTVSGNQVAVVTHQVVYLSVKSLQTRNQANVVDKTITDVYDLAVDDHGKMVMKRTSNTNDQSKTDSANGFVNFFTNVNDIFDTLKGISVNNTKLDTGNIKAFQDFIFPGGQTFAFKNFHFSDNQDLLASITYSDPN